MGKAAGELRAASCQCAGRPAPTHVRVVPLFNREALEAYGVLRERAARNKSRRLGFESPVLMRGSDELRGENVPDRDLARCSFSAASCTWHALRFGGDRLAGRLATLWSRHGAAWDSWGSKRTGRGFSLWQSVQFCWCRGPVSNPRAPSVARSIGASAWAHAVYPWMLCCPHGVIRFQHRRKISSILIRNTLAPIAIRTAPGSCLAIEGVKSPKTRSCYEYHPPGPSKKVRTAVGRQICAADSFGRTSKPAAGEREPADCRACQIKRKTRPG